ncbi:hypothetical protein EIP91_006910 [Steccherinum ochraceum]|uniref:Uncharacterized protein n=1 Tax=Steccherinum ochraceum TaxID=92696 RepID=A0A4R0RFJ6_9APHY|nr:hypothetical protein EIP91_006910 [Steccherinum ochraceum]
MTFNHAELTTIVVPLITFGIGISGDLLVLAITWVKTADTWRAGAKAGQFRPALTTLLLRDGTTYFLTLLLLGIISFVLNITQTDQNNTTSFTTVVDAITANLTARFILDLRSVYYKGSSQQSHVLSTVKFAGNMGAPLGVDDSIWMSSPADDVRNARDEEYEEEEDPFCAGLKMDADAGLQMISPQEPLSAGIAEHLSSMKEVVEV